MSNQPANNGEPEARGDSSGQQNTSRQNTTAAVKCCFVCPNGGRHSKPRKIVIPPRLRNRWEGVLQQVDETIPIFGGCYHLQKVADQEFTEVFGFDELEDGELYVALNNTEKLTKMDYKSLLHNSRSPSPRRSQQSTASKKAKARKIPDVESKFMKVPPCVRISVYANGNYHARHQVNLEPAEVYERRATVFRNKICLPMEFVYRQIEDTCNVSLPGHQCIRKMVNAKDGNIVKSPREIEDGAVYILCGHEEFMGFDGLKPLQRLQFGRFVHNPQKFLTIPRSAKNPKTSRRGKDPETARDSSRDPKSQRKQGKENGHPESNGYETGREHHSHDQNDRYGHDNDPYRQDNDPYGQDANHYGDSGDQQNGWQNGDQYAHDQNDQADNDRKTSDQTAGQNNSHDPNNEEDSRLGGGDAENAQENNY